MKKAKAVQWLRRAVQAGVLLMVLMAPFMAQYRVLLANNEIENLRQQGKSNLSNRIYLTIDDSIRGRVNKNPSYNSATEREKIVGKLERLQGNTWSAKIFGISLTDPLGGLESVFASKTASQSLLVGMLVPMLATILLGRVFCSWMCPAGLIFEMTDRLRYFLPRIGIPLRSISFSTLNKYTLLSAGLVIVFMAGLPLLGYFYPPAILGREVHQAADVLFYEAMPSTEAIGPLVLSGALLFFVLIILIEVAVAKRMWCRYFCPGGALYALLGWRRVFRIGNETSRCTHCVECVKVCPMGLNPMKPDPGLECDNCLVCLTTCEPGSLSLNLRFKRVKIEPTISEMEKPQAKIAC